MWALRRAANPLRVRARQVVTARGCANLELLPDADSKNVAEHHGRDCQKACCCYHPQPPAYRLAASGHFKWGRSFSSQAGTNSGDKEDGLEDGFSDLEVAPVDDKKDGCLTSEDNSDEDTIDEVGLDDAEPDKEHTKKSNHSPLVKLMIETRRHEVTSSLKKWAEDGNTLERAELFNAIFALRKRKWFSKALELMEWIEKSKLIEFGERDYASRLDLVAKVYGLHHAEKYIERIPASHRNELIYRTLLANCVHQVNLKKAEQLFNKMKDLGFEVTVFSCNQLLLLYKRVDKKKIADVLTMMEKENVKPSLFTYKLLVDTKGAAKDIEGMEKVIESMQADGLEPDLMFTAMIARHYIFAVHHEKAEALLESMEGDDINANRAACRILLPLYAFLGKCDDVERIWKVCEANPYLHESLSAIEAYGRLGNVEKAEKVFEDMLLKWKTLSSKCYDAMLKVYANQNLLDKGKELIKRMDAHGARIGTQAIDSLVRLYVSAGEVEKADSVLHKLSLKNRLKPQYNSYLTLLDNYAKKGDVPNAEKVFHKLREMGYVGRIRQYQLLLHAYLHAKTPAYGFRERMKADNIFPNSAVATLLASTDPFVKKKSISALLD